MRQLLLGCWLILTVLATSGFSVQKSPDAIPADNHPLWKTLATTKEVFKNEMVLPAFTKEVQALDQTTITISGFMMPLEETEQQKHFLLSKYSPSCPFCMPGGPNEIIEVFCDKPVAFSFNPVTLTGQMELVKDANDWGIFYRLKKASVKSD